MAVAAVRHRFTVADYHRMAEAGILDQRARVELIDGEIIDMSPIGRTHKACVDHLNRLFVQRLGDKAIVRVQSGVPVSEHSEPEPDLALLRERPDFYADTDAGSADVLLIVEVADTSLAYDRRRKVPMYARNGIPEVWVVDVNGERVFVYREPRPEGCRVTFEVRGQAGLSPLAFPELLLTADDVVGWLGSGRGNDLPGSADNP